MQLLWLKTIEKATTMGVAFAALYHTMKFISVTATLTRPDTPKAT